MDFSIEPYPVHAGDSKSPARRACRFYSGPGHHRQALDYHGENQKRFDAVPLTADE